MNAVIYPRPIEGRIDAIPSKSHLHRLMICSALSEAPVSIPCPGAVSDDILATAECLRALGAGVELSDGAISVSPIGSRPASAVLDCGESGSTYRFTVPIAAALVPDARFILGGRLPQRPMDALWRALAPHGVSASGCGTAEVKLTGRLTPGRFELPGDVSSQFITGLLFALPLLEGDSEIALTSPLRSAGYIDMTLDALRLFGVSVESAGSGWRIPGGQKYSPPRALFADGDWSSAAIWLCAAAACSHEVTVGRLSLASSQGDRAIFDILRRFGADLTAGEDGVTVRSGAVLRGVRVDAGDVPDLVPAIAVAAAAAEGDTVIENVRRLRLKESDRVQSVCSTLCALGVSARHDENTITVTGGPVSGGRTSSFGDHRIAMLAAALSALSSGEIVLTGAEAVSKSYPGFWRDMNALGGCVTLKNEEA